MRFTLAPCLPGMDDLCLEAFLEYLGEAYVDYHLLSALDGALSHTSEHNTSGSRENRSFRLKLVPNVQKAVSCASSSIGVFCGGRVIGSGGGWVIGKAPAPSRLTCSASEYRAGRQARTARIVAREETANQLTRSVEPRDARVGCVEDA